MNTVMRRTVGITTLLLTLGGRPSWGAPPNNDVSDAQLNTAGGTGALGVTAGFNSTAFGYHALQSDTTGTNNTAFGGEALASTTTGNKNTAIGAEALFSNTTGTENTACGFVALINNTTGFGNTATGGEALFSNTTGFDNTATGIIALLSNTTGRENTATGSAALFNNTTGMENTATGVAALDQNTTGSDNTAFGVAALDQNTTGSNNAAFGVAALDENTAGTGNAAFGTNALLDSTGSNNIAVGSQAGSQLKSGNNNIYLGHVGGASESQTQRLGQRQTRTFIAGIAGRAVSGSQVLITTQGQLGILASSARYKRDIQDLGARSRKLHQLRPVTFRYKADTQGVRQYGLIAEEVARVYPELVTRGADGRVEAVQYHELIALLLNEVQHEQRALSELTAETQRLRAAHAQELVDLKAQNEEQRLQNAALAVRLERLEADGVRAATLISH